MTEDIINRIVKTIEEETSKISKENADHNIEYGRVDQFDYGFERGLEEAHSIIKTIIESECPNLFKKIKWEN